MKIYAISKLARRTARVKSIESSQEWRKIRKSKFYAGLKEEGTGEREEGREIKGEKGKLYLVVIEQTHSPTISNITYEKTGSGEEGGILFPKYT